MKRQIIVKIVPEAILLGGILDRADILEKLSLVVVDILGVDKSKVHENASFTDDLGADSLDIVELVMALESEFDFSIPDEKIEELSTVAKVLDFIADQN